MSGSDQLKGWKEIAAFLRVSERTAQRWEQERGVPVRRLPGAGKDSVFAVSDGLEAWQRSNHGPADEQGERGADSSARGAEGRMPDSPASASLEAPPPARRRRWSLIAGVGLIGAGFAIGAIWISGWPSRLGPGLAPRLAPAPHIQTPTARSEAEPAPVVLPACRFEISGPDGWRAEVEAADGGAVQIGGSAGRPPLILRPRMVRGRLLLEIARADGRPMKDRGEKSQPMVLALDPDVTVDLRQPSPFSVRWLSGAPVAK